MRIPLRFPYWALLLVVALVVGCSSNSTGSRGRLSDVGIMNASSRAVDESVLEWGETFWFRFGSLPPRRSGGSLICLSSRAADGGSEPDYTARRKEKRGQAAFLHGSEEVICSYLQSSHLRAFVSVEEKKWPVPFFHVSPRADRPRLGNPLIPRAPRLHDPAESL